MHTHLSTSRLSQFHGPQRWGFGLFLWALLALALIGSNPVHAETVNINKADVAAMQEHLKGIGPVKSQAIVDYRRKHGPFKSVDDLKNVPGIGDGTLKQIRRNVSTSKGVTKASDGFKAKKAGSKSSSASTKKDKGKSSNSSQAKSDKKKSAKSKSDDKSKSSAKSDSSDKSKTAKSKSGKDSKKAKSTKSKSTKSKSTKTSSKEKSSKSKSKSKSSKDKKKTKK